MNKINERADQTQLLCSMLECALACCEWVLVVAKGEAFNFIQCLIDLHFATWIPLSELYQRKDLFWSKLLHKSRSHRRRKQYITHKNIEGTENVSEHSSMLRIRHAVVLFVRTSQVIHSAMFSDSCFILPFCPVMNCKWLVYAYNCLRPTKRLDLQSCVAHRDHLSKRYHGHSHLVGFDGQDALL